MIHLLRFFLSWTVAIVVVGGLTAAIYYYHRVDEEVRRHIEGMLSQQYPRHKISIGSAHFVQGEGIRLRDVQIVRPALGDQERVELLFCQEIELQCTPTIQDLTQGKVDIPHVLLRGLMLRPTRELDGSWNLVELLPSRPSSQLNPSITIQDARVELIDRRLTPPSVMELKNLQLSLTPPPERRDPSVAKVISIRGGFSSDHVREVTLSGWIDLETHQWGIQGTAADLQFSPSLLRSLPAEASLPLAKLDGLHARINLGFAASNIPEVESDVSTTPWYRIEGNMTEGRIDASRPLPLPITDLSAQRITADLSGWEVEGLKARYGTATVSLSARQSQADGPIDVHGEIEQLNVTRELVHSLPGSIQSIWEKYQGLGIVDVRFNSHQVEQRWWTEAEVTCRDVSLLYSRFPYPLVRTQGRVYFRQHERLEVDLWGSADNADDRTSINILATVDRPGPHFQGTIQIRSNDWLPLDRKLTSAMPESTRAILQDLNAHGKIHFTASFRKDETTNQELRRDLVIDVQQGEIQHARFPYPLNQVEGRIHVQDHRWDFLNLRGFNDSCFVNCREGTWMPMDDKQKGELSMRFVATDIPCDAELRDALPSGPQFVWKNLRPTGTLDHADITLKYRTGMKAPIIDLKVTQVKREEDPERRGLVIQPSWFPLRMDEVTGVVEYNHDGTIVLREIEAVHGSAERARTLRMPSGEGNFRPDGSWEIHLQRIVADGMDTTPELLNSLPTSLSEALNQIGFQGKLSIDGGLRFQGGLPDQPSITSDWNLLANVDDGSFDVASHRVEHVFGQVGIVGGSQQGASINAGIAKFDSLICRGIQVTQLEIPWRLQASQLLFGAAASPDEIAADRRRARGMVFDGNVEADGVISLEREPSFQLQIDLTDLKLALLAREFRLPPNTTGRGFMRLSVSGTAQGSHTLQGTGIVRLREANLARLPAIIALVNELRVRQAPPDVFSEADIDFDLEGPNLNFTRFDLHGESLSLKGKGWMSLDRQINLTFHTILGGERGWMPFVRPLLGQASQQILQLHVTGPMDNLRWSREVLPGLNETLQQLFPEQSRVDDDRRTSSLERAGGRRTAR